MADALHPSALTILPLQLAGVHFAMGEVHILSDVSVALHAKTRTIVLGPNGAGKSVLLRLMHGLLTPSAGAVHWARADAQRAQAMVFQRPVMLRLSALENITFALRVAGRGNARALALQALTRVGLAALADRPARLCSGGEQQRIALARAWALNPEVLFLDEPTASLDPAAAKAVEDVIGAMHASGTTLVMTTHDLGQARRLADRVLFLHQGKLLEDAPAATFFTQPRTPEATAFVKGELLC